MSDSIEILFKAKHAMSYEEAEKAFPGLCTFWSKRDVSYAASGVEKKLNSPLNKNGFKVTPYIDRVEQQFLGFMVKVNIPSVTIGINAILQTLPYHSAKIALLLLQNEMKAIGVHEQVWRRFGLKNSEFHMITLNYLKFFKKYDDANAAREQLKQRASVVLLRKAFSAIADLMDDSETLYLKKRNCPSYRVYVKTKDISDSGYYFSDELKEEIFSISGRILRIEAVLHYSYLKKKFPEALSPIFWKNAENNRHVLNSVFNEFRSVLRLDEIFRNNMIRKYDFLKLSQKMQNFLTLYFKGEEEKCWKSMNVKERSELKRLIMSKTRIDVTLPWSSRGKLKQLSWAIEPKPYRLPDYLGHLQEFVFDKISALKVINKLKEMLETKLVASGIERNQSISGVEEVLTGFEKLKIPRISGMIE